MSPTKSCPLAPRLRHVSTIFPWTPLGMVTINKSKSIQDRELLEILRKTICYFRNIWICHNSFMHSFIHLQYSDWKMRYCKYSFQCCLERGPSHNPTTHSTPSSITNRDTGHRDNCVYRYLQIIFKFYQENISRISTLQLMASEWLHSLWRNWEGL